MTSLFFKLALASMALAAVSLVSGSDIDYWASLNTQELEWGEKWKTVSHFQLRSPEMEFLHYGRVSQKFRRSLSDQWRFGVNPAIEFKRRDPSEPWANDYRIEMEALGSFRFGKGPGISTRSRWEFRWKDGSGSRVFHRVRQQIKAQWKLTGWGTLESFAMANETFYELDRGQIVSNRLYPIMVSFQSSNRLKPGMWLSWVSQRSRGTDQWTGNYVLGLDFKY